MIRGYPGSYQLPRYQGLRYNYPPFYSGFSISVSSPLPDSHTMKSLTSKRESLIDVPMIDWNRCVGCGTCVKNCPIGAIEIVVDKAHINPETCIRCGTCSRLCPRNAII